MSRSRRDVHVVWPPSERSETARRALAAKSPEARKESARKAAESRRRNREAAKGEASG